MTPADELNIEDRAALQRYLHSNFAPAAEFEIVEFEVLAGGVSGRTVRVTLSDGQAWVLKQALAKLRVKADWFSDPRRIHREALGMKVLGELTPPGSVPKLIFDDETHHVLGMEAVPQPHENWKTMLLDGRVNGEHFEIFGRLLADIHYGGYLARDKYEKAFDDRSFFESLRIEPYYLYSARHAPQAKEFLDQLVHDTRQQRLSLVHGDYSPKNVLIQGPNLVLLDHEVIHWGDPAFDIGFALSHFITKGRKNEWIRYHCENFWHAYQFGDGGFGFDQLHSEEYLERCLRHALGCLLARAIGRSPLEYLSVDERRQQCNVVIRLMQAPPKDFRSLLERFYQEIER